MKIAKLTFWHFEGGWGIRDQKIFVIHLEEHLNKYTEFHGNQSKSCWDISVKTKCEAYWWSRRKSAKWLWFILCGLWIYVKSFRAIYQTVFEIFHLSNCIHATECCVHSRHSPLSLLPFPFHSTDYLIIHPSLCWNGVLILSICVRHCWGSKGKACHSLFTPPLHFNSSPTKPWIWFHSALKSKISLQAGAPPGLRQQGEVGQVPGSVGRWILEILGHSEMNERVN